jgi:hypothetical protein
MTRNVGKLLMALCVLVVGGGVVANAQINSGRAITTNIPFDFMVGDTTLPAGKYELSRLDDDIKSVLQLRSVNGRTAVAFDTEPTQTSNDQAVHKTELLFNKVGDQYFLSQVWVAGDAEGRELMPSRIEKKLSAGGNQPERHSVVAVLKRLKP